jgi:hypoxanthine phosphoribosyltransferase
VLPIEKVKINCGKRFIKCFDYDKIVNGLKVRNRISGDRFTPLGMDGSKKLKDFFIDEKIPKEERDAIPLIVDGKEIIWVVGYRMNEKYKVTSNTKNVILIKYYKNYEELRRIRMKDFIKEILVSSDEIEKRVGELGKQITEDYKGKDLLLVGILKGAVIFMADLAKNIDLPITMDFMAVSSYGKSSESSGVVKIIKDLDSSVEGKDILIVEDIIDTGFTLGYLTDYLKRRGASSVKICTLLDKPDRRKIQVPVDYKGFVIPDEFVVGYGLDYAEQYRNLPYISALKEEVYS